MIYLTSDTHFRHANIIKYCNRPFNSVDQMDNTLMKNWNNTVKNADTIIILGDFAFKDVKWFISQLNGNKVFVSGNHDQKFYINALEIEYKGIEMYCTHKPEEYHQGFKVNLVGHVHQKWKTKKLKKGNILINVGTDVWNYTPVSLKQIKEVIGDIK